MFKHPATIQNIEKLKSFGNIFVEPNDGELASGLIGKGRMAEPEQIIEEVKSFFSQKKKFNGKTILVTAGPTHEPIDAVRFIGNHSSGKMGIAISKELSNQGANVILVLGPVAEVPQIPNCRIVNVTTANEMFDASFIVFPETDGAILSAAVADFTPTTKSDRKIKRTGNSLNISLSPTDDIAAALGKQKRSNQFLLGFALETDNELENAKLKMKKKNFDLIVLNSLNDDGAGFGYDTNKITILTKNDTIKEYPLKLKSEVAKDILQAIYETNVKS
jgi:phosphopantothenoylcysteine decarboxylase/phosphopantothenate--cysteine ligase